MGNPCLLLRNESLSCREPVTDDTTGKEAPASSLVAGLLAESHQGFSLGFNGGALCNATQFWLWSLGSSLRPMILRMS
jgi:hypothetical protein